VRLGRAVPFGWKGRKGKNGINGSNRRNGKVVERGDGGAGRGGCSVRFPREKMEVKKYN